MLSISPFWYNCTVVMILDNGSMYPPEVLDITMESVRGRILNTVLTRVAPLSLALGIPNAASAPHMILNAFKNVLAVAVATDITFKEAEAVKAYLADPSAFVAAAPAGGGGGGDKPAAAAKVEEKEESEEEDMDMGLFD
jgi:large subunit ribosomal protein LP0